MSRNILLCLLMVISVALQAEDAEVRAKAREVYGKNKDAVVSVKIVTKTHYVFSGAQMHDQEQKREVTGTIIDPSGLCIISESSSDPMNGMDFSFEDEGETMKFKPETKVTDLKIIYPDGTEIAAEFALKDKDLDVAFVRPKEKLEKPAPFLALAKAADPEVLDPVISIGRLGRTLNRASTVNIERVEAIVTKPRTFYVCSTATLGAPVFNMKGETLGVLLMRKNPIKTRGADYADMSYVVLPAEDLLEASKQALAAKPEETKAAEK